MRKAAGLTQAQLAFILDVSSYTIIRWEQGRGEPSASTIRRLAWALRVSEAEVLEAICAKRTA